MKKTLSSNKVYVMQSGIPDAGRGVYARRDIKKGEIIEKCPVIDVPTYDMANLKDSSLIAYFFFYGKGNKRVLIALGFGSIYNHSYEPNAIYKIKPIDMTIEFRALIDIKKDDEITFNYKNKPKGKYPLWFETKSAAD